MGNLDLPPGFRFHPTDEELVAYYLRRKCASQPIAVPIVAEIEVYKHDPWELPALALCGDEEWYFFSPTPSDGKHSNRAAGSGYWKATGADRPIKPGGSLKPLGIKKALVFYAGRAPKGERTNWIMHEYRLADVDRSADDKNSPRLEDWILCRIYKQNGESLKKIHDGEAEAEEKPEIETPIQHLHQQQVAPPIFADFHYLDSSESMPRLQPKDSGSWEHVISLDTASARKVQKQAAAGGGQERSSSSWWPALVSFISILFLLHACFRSGHMFPFDCWL